MLNKKGQMQMIELVIVAVMFIFMMYIFLNVTNPISNLLYVFLDNSENGIANASVIKTLFQLLPLVLAFLGLMYLLSYMNRPKEYPPTY